MTVPPYIAHLGPVEMFTPKAQESLDFFVDIMGMEIQHRDGQSVYLRGWGDYHPWSLKLTEARTNGMGALGFRAWNQEALERRVEAVEAWGLGQGWNDGDYARGPSYRFADPSGHVFELYYEAERYVAPDHLKPSLKNVPQRLTGRGIGVKRMDHINLLASDPSANRRFAMEALTYRLYEQVILDSGVEAGAWMSVSMAAHELIYTHDAKDLDGRLHHVAFWVDTPQELLRAADLWLDNGVFIEASPAKHAVANGLFLYGYEPGGNRVEVTTGGYFVFDPDQPAVQWTEAERKLGQAWRNKTIESFHTYGTPEGGLAEAVEPAVPAVA